MLETLLNIAFLLIAPFLFIGIINKTKAFWGGRKGASVLQPFYNFIKLIFNLVITKNIILLFDLSPFSITINLKLRTRADTGQYLLFKIMIPKKQPN